MKIKNVFLVMMTFFLFLTGCSSEEVNLNDSESNNTEEVVEETVSEEVEEEPEEVEEDEVSSSDIGKRSSPVPLGDSIEFVDRYYDENFDEKFDALLNLGIKDIVRGEDAYNILIQENQFNDPAPEGMEWLIITLEAELLEGDEDNPYTIVPWFDIVDSSGSEISQDDYGTLDGDEYGYVDLFPGGTNSGRITLYGPENDDSLLSLDTNEGKIYFSLTK